MMAPVVRSFCSKGHDNWCSGSFSGGPAIRRGVRVWCKLCRLPKGCHDSNTTYVYNIVVNSWILCKIVLHLWHKIRSFYDYATDCFQLVTKVGTVRCMGVLSASPRPGGRREGITQILGRKGGGTIMSMYYRWGPWIQIAS